MRQGLNVNDVSTNHSCIALYINISMIYTKVLKRTDIWFVAIIISHPWFWQELPPRLVIPVIVWRLVSDFPKKQDFLPGSMKGQDSGHELTPGCFIPDMTSSTVSTGSILIFSAEILSNLSVYTETAVTAHHTRYFTVHFYLYLIINH